MLLRNQAEEGTPKGIPKIHPNISLKTCVAVQMALKMYQACSMSTMLQF